MNRRIIIIISAIVFLLAVFGGLVFWAVKKQNQSKQPPVVTPQIKKVLDETVISPIAALDNSAVWYFNSEGRLFRINVDGSGLTEFPLPSLTTGTLKQALWPRTGTDFIAIASSGSGYVKSYYSTAQKIYVNLPSNVQYVDWMPDGVRVLYIWKASDNVHQQLVMANADGTGYQAINSVYWPDLKVLAAPDGKTALLMRSNIQGDINKIYSADLTTGKVTTLVEQGKNISAIWSPTGGKFVFSRAVGDSVYPKLLLYDSSVQGSLDMNLNTTLDKIVIDKDGKYLYAAVPKKDNSGEIFVKVDLSNLKQETYFEPTSTVRAKNLILVGDSLYYTDTQDLKFYMIVK